MGTDLLPFSEVTAAIAAVSVLGIFLLLPLYLSQRRDVLRLRSGCRRTRTSPRRTSPSPSSASTRPSAISRTRIRRARRAGARHGGVRGDQGRDAGEGSEEGPSPSASRVSTESLLTSERPALAQVTMERPRSSRTRAGSMFVAAHHPAPLARRHRGRSRWSSASAGSSSSTGSCARTSPATPAASQASRHRGRSPQHDHGERHRGPRRERRSRTAGFIRGEVGNIERDTSQTLVMYAPDQERAAKRVARELGDVAVQKIDREVQAAAGGADVVVILGQDRVG